MKVKAIETCKACGESLSGGVCGSCLIVAFAERESKAKLDRFRLREARKLKRGSKQRRAERATAGIVWERRS